jgi:hypothetical protein
MVVCIIHQLLSAHQNRKISQRFKNWILQSKILRCWDNLFFIYLTGIYLALDILLLGYKIYIKLIVETYQQIHLSIEHIFCFNLKTSYFEIYYFFCLFFNWSQTLFWVVWCLWRWRSRAKIFVKWRIIYVMPLVHGI